MTSYTTITIKKVNTLGRESSIGYLSDVRWKPTFAPCIKSLPAPVSNIPDLELPATTYEETADLVILDYIRSQIS